MTTIRKPAPILLPSDELEALAFDYRVPLTLTADRAYATVHGVEFYAVLPGGAA